MTNYFERIINITTGEETIRPYNANEIAAAEKLQTQLSAKQAEQDAKDELKAAARQTVLTKLGLTVEEMAALLG